MANTLGTLPAKQDANQEYTIMGISGTLGPTYGTAEPRPLTVGENGYLNVNAAAANSTGGTIDLIKTVGTLQLGTVTVTNPTGTTVQFNNGTVDLIKAGTITRVEQGSINVTAGTIASVGTVPGVGVVTSITNVASGTLLSSGTTTGVGVVTSVTNLAAGTITKLEGGTLGVVTTVSNLSAGSVAVTAGTVIVTNGTIGAGTVAISAGTIGGKAASGAAAVANPVLTAGTDAGGTIYAPLMTTTGHQLIDILTGTIQSSGTTTGVGVVTTVTSLSAGTITKLEGGTLGILSQGSINVTAGTMIMTAGTVAAGTIAVSAGTVTHGTIDAGTFALNPKPSIVVNSFGTTTAATIGTLIAAPSAGSAIFITSLDINLQNGTTETVVSYGLVANGNQVVSRGNYTAGGGIAKTYIPANSGSATGTALTWNVLGAAGTFSYNVAYFIAVP